MEKDLLSRYILITTASIIYKVHRVKPTTISLFKVFTLCTDINATLFLTQNYKITGHDKILRECLSSILVYYSNPTPPSCNGGNKFII